MRKKCFFIFSTSKVSVRDSICPGKINDVINCDVINCDVINCDVINFYITGNLFELFMSTCVHVCPHVLSEWEEVLYFNSFIITMCNDSIFNT